MVELIFQLVRHVDIDDICVLQCYQSESTTARMKRAYFGIAHL